MFGNNLTSRRFTSLDINETALTLISKGSLPRGKMVQGFGFYSSIVSRAIRSTDSEVRKLPVSFQIWKPQRDYRGDNVSEASDVHKFKLVYNLDLHVSFSNDQPIHLVSNFS